MKTSYAIYREFECNGALSWLKTRWIWRLLRSIARRRQGRMESGCAACYDTTSAAAKCVARARGGSSDSKSVLATSV